MSICKSLNNTFNQIGQTCLLSSYAVVGNYFSEEPILSYFAAYNEHFNLPNDRIEQTHENHIHNYLNSMRISGYNLLIDIHNTSKIEAFKNARKLFSTSKIELNNGIIDTGDFSEQNISDILINTNSLLNLFINQPDVYFSADLKAGHSILVYCINGKYYYHDTNYPSKMYELPNNFYKFKGFGDKILYSCSNKS